MIATDSHRRNSSRPTGRVLRSTGNFAQKSSSRPVTQWLVPSDLVILFQTLYLPTGFFIGRRFTSFSVSAS